MSAVHWICVSNADSGQVMVLRRDVDAKLSHQHTLDLGGQLMPMALDRSGRYLLAASYHSHLLSVSTIDDHGRVAPAHQIVPTGPNAHSVLAAPSNRHVMAACLGADEVLCLGFDAQAGLMQTSPTVWPARAGSGPRHLRFWGDRVFLLNELNATVQVLSFDEHRGQLALLQTESVLPPGFEGKPWAADLCLSADGRLLFCSERTSSTLTVFALDGPGPTLRKLAQVQTEAQPRGIACVGSDQLLVVGQQSDHLSSYRVDAQSGALQVLQRLPMGRNPNWIEVMAP